MEKYFVIQTHVKTSVKKGYAVLIQFLENIPWYRVSQAFSTSTTSFEPGVCLLYSVLNLLLRLN
jgi:hypothetical protein